MKKLTIWLIVAFVFRFAISFLAWHPDLRNHADWGIRFFQYGASRFYAPESNVWSFTWPNQPPGTIYMFAGIRKLYEGVFAGLSYLHFQVHIFPGSVLLYLEQNLYPAMLKLPAEVADLGIAYLIYKMVTGLIKDEKKGKRLAVVGAVIFLFNPVIWYNSAVWGQYDSVINFLALLAFYLLLKKRLIPSTLSLALSLYIKASLLIFVPIYIIIALRQKYRISQYVLAVLLPLLLIGLATLPFSQGEPFTWLTNLYVNKVFGHQLQVITANAFNIWATITGISERPQTLPFLGLTYQYWSYILFSIFYLPVLWLVFKKQNMNLAVWALAVAAFASFGLLTNMHERYLYPFFPCFTVLLVVYPEFFVNYVATSIINLLNLYNFWFMPYSAPLVSFLSAWDRLAPRVLGGVSFALFMLFYLRFVSYNFGKVHK